MQALQLKTGGSDTPGPREWEAGSFASSTGENKWTQGYRKDGARGSHGEKVRGRRASHAGPGEGGRFPELTEATVLLAASAHVLPLNRTFIFCVWRRQEEPGPGVSPVKGRGGQRPPGASSSCSSCSLSCPAHSPGLCSAFPLLLGRWKSAS